MGKNDSHHLSFEVRDASGEGGSLGPCLICHPKDQRQEPVILKMTQAEVGGGEGRHIN